MRKSRQFENVLDECLERLLDKGETVEQCLGSFPEHRDVLKPLLETALATKQASAIQPRPEFRDKARYQFYSALQERRVKKSRLFFSWGWPPRWAAVVAVALAFLLAGSGTVAAASGSMPDEPLYAVKLATEQARLALTPSALGKAELYAKLADRRVIEIVRMADESKPEQIEQTAQRLDTYLTKIADLASAQETATVPTVPTMAPATKEALTPAPEEAQVFEEAPPPQLPEQAKGDKKAHIKVDRRAGLKTTVELQAKNHTERLRALLETVPPSARSALLQAIAISEAGYEKALKSLD